MIPHCYRVHCFVWSSSGGSRVKLLSRQSATSRLCYSTTTSPSRIFFEDHDSHQSPIDDDDDDMASPYGKAPQYPYPPSSYGNSTTTFNNGKTPSDDVRGISRTPSPTPSEVAELLRDGVMDYKAMMNWRFWIRREWLCTPDVSFFVAQWLMGACLQGTMLSEVSF